MTRYLTLAALLPAVLPGCATSIPPIPDVKRVSVPTPTAADPFQGLPAMSGDGKLLALPTYSTDETGQHRSIAFISVGDTEGTGTTLELPTAPPDPFITTLTERYREGRYTSLPWVITPDDPPLPLTLTVKGTELYVAGDPKAALALAVGADGKQVGNDVYQVEGVSQTSPEHVVAVGATVLWYDERGLAYVRYDINDGVGRDSDWRVVALEKPASGAPKAAEPKAVEPAK